MVNPDYDFFAYVDNIAIKSDINSFCVFDNLDNKPIVTIGIPTYKRANTLKDAIESALNQNCNFSYSILVLDNNPERGDETELLMNDYSDQPAVSYYKNSENLGMGGNWNRIVSLSQSEWVVLLHDDDLIANSFLKDMLEVANRFKADVVNSAFLFWHEKNETRPSFTYEKKQYKVIRSSLGANFFYNRGGMPTGILCKRSIFIKEGGVNDELYPAFDWVFNSLLSYKYKFLLYEKKLTIYRYAINTYMKKETIKTYMPINFSFMHYVGNILHYPDWFVNLYTDLEMKAWVSRLGDKSYMMFGKKFKPLNSITAFVRKILFKAFQVYYDKRNCLGSF